jgi:DinB superfamily
MDDLIPRVQTVLATTLARWLSMTATMPEELLRRAPAPGEWSALECLRHLIDVERSVFPVRVRAILAGQDLAAFDPDKDGADDIGQTPAELAAAFAQSRAASLVTLGQVRNADLERTARHSELGVVRLEELLNEWAAHDFNHTIQAESAVMQPFIAGSGPWRFYFRDHDVDAGEKA